ncbi:hypothetical protein C8Q79DRAFT_540724 [Trametes meyenii]|nr:hypothetical protein C8Q79DRAFT_540724 [Trametes meyenii]
MPSSQLLPASALRGICESLMQPDDGVSLGERFTGQKTLLILARTSRAFHEHALDALWSTLPGYGFIVYTLPADAWKVEIQEWAFASQSSPLLSVIRPLVPGDFTRLKYCAPRVRRIVPCNKRSRPSCVVDCGFSTSILDAFANCFQLPSSEWHVLFPNLQELHFVQQSGMFNNRHTLCYRSAHVLFGPTLQSFRTTPSGQRLELAQDFERMLAILPQLSPHMASFKASAEDTIVRLTRVVSSSVMRFQHLVSVDTGAITLDSHTLLCLARMPSLQRLKTRLENSPSILSNDRALPNATEVHFPNLRELSLAHSNSLDTISEFTHVVDSTSLVYVSLRVEAGRIPLATIKTLLAKIASWTSLRTVKITVAGLRDNADMITGDVLPPLYTLRMLSCLVINARGLFAFDDGDARVMAGSWPSLTRLELGPGIVRRQPPTPSVTLPGLLSFAQHCPDLRCLGIPLDTNLGLIGPAWRRDVRPSLGTPQNRLRELKVGHSEIEDPVAVAALALRSARTKRTSPVSTRTRCVSECSRVLSAHLSICGYWSGCKGPDRHYTEYSRISCNPARSSPMSKRLNTVDTRWNPPVFTF